MLAAMDGSGKAHLQRALELAAANVELGGGPFGAVLVMPDGASFEAANRVTLDNDPTAHAEVAAIRKACAALGTFQLEGAVIYTSCEPCPMCLAASLWARVGRVYYAADRHDAARAGFDDAEFYDFLERREAGAEHEEQMIVQRVEAEGAEAPFAAWMASERRVEY